MKCPCSTFVLSGDSFPTSKIEMFCFGDLGQGEFKGNLIIKTFSCSTSAKCSDDFFFVYLQSTLYELRFAMIRMSEGEAHKTHSTVTECLSL